MKDIREDSWEKVKNSEIIIEGGNLHELVDKCEELLILHDAGIYQRGGYLVEISRIKNNNNQYIKRSDELHIIVPSRASSIRELCTKFGTWKKYDSRSRDYKEIDCPRDIASTLIERSKWNLPVLRALLGAPTVTSTGRLIIKPGYDYGTGLYSTYKSWESIPNKFEQTDAINARLLLEDLINEFPFIDSAARAAWLAAFLTSLVRWQLSAAPFFGIDAPIMGSGKTLLATIISLLVNAQPPSVMTQPRDESETKKAILAILIAGDSLLLMDNVEQVVSGETLCTISTSETYRDRLLGETKMISVSTAVTLLMTGNNLTVKGDLSTRMLISRLDPASEHPEERVFKRENIKDYVLENRISLVNAGLTIIKAYIDTGMPDVGLKAFGRFEEWDKLVRYPLVWSGATDPCETRKRVETIDPEREQHGELLLAWFNLYGEKEVLVATMIQNATSGGDEDTQKLKDSLLSIAGDGSKINSRRLGRKIGRWEGRVSDDMRIVRGSLIHRAQAWRLENLGGNGRNGGNIDSNVRISQTNKNLEKKETHETPKTQVQEPRKNTSLNNAVIDILVETIKGLDITLEQLQSKFSSQDINDIESGKILQNG